MSKVTLDRLLRILERIYYVIKKPKEKEGYLDKYFDGNAINMIEEAKRNDAYFYLIYKYWEKIYFVHS